jgi:hypothetical protein
MDFQRSLFGNKEDDGVIAKKIIKKLTPMVKKGLVIPPSEIGEIKEKAPPVLSSVDLPYAKEVELLLGATIKRSFLPSYIDHERKMISDHLVGVAKKTGRNIEAIVSLSVLILKNRLNLYTTQAVDFATEGHSFGLLEKNNSVPATKKSIFIRRKV